MTWYSGASVRASSGAYHAMSSASGLDGGGSTTMVVKGKVVNRPSDPFGSRPVSDAIVVLSKPRG